jgi:hypothetical protein
VVHHYDGTIVGDCDPPEAVEDRPNVVRAIDIDPCPDERGPGVDDDKLRLVSLDLVFEKLQSFRVQRERGGDRVHAREIRADSRSLGRSVSSKSSSVLQRRT